jgi:1-acyl-sn-glycerol-3-phosphate acyltransferase
VSRTLRRRLVTIPAVLAAWVILVSGAPLWLASAAVIDLVAGGKRARWSRLRLVAFGGVYATLEAVGLTRLFGSWLLHRSNRDRLQSETYAIQSWWTGKLLASIARLYGLSLAVEGLERFAPGPTLVLVRHTSILDTLLPTVLLSSPAGMRLRFVLKRELEVVPCLDVAGHRVPNYFVERDGSSTEREVAQVAALARDLGERDGVLLYPEGTRFSEKKRSASLGKLAASDPARFARLSELRHLLPVRPGGVLALLDAAPEADVVIVSHTGLEGLAELGDIVRGGLVGRAIRLRVDRFARQALPRDAAERLAWIDERWLELDRSLRTHETRGR